MVEHSSCRLLERPRTGRIGTCAAESHLHPGHFRKVLTLGEKEPSRLLRLVRLAVARGRGVELAPFRRGLEQLQLEAAVVGAYPHRTVESGPLRTDAALPDDAAVERHAERVGGEAGPDAMPSPRSERGYARRARRPHVAVPPPVALRA